MTECGACSVVEIFNLEIIFMNFRSLASRWLPLMGSQRMNNEKQWKPGTEPRVLDGKLNFDRKWRMLSSRRTQLQNNLHQFLILGFSLASGNGKPRGSQRLNNRKQWKPSSERFWRKN